MSSRVREERESAIIRFAGDSGDGMQLTGSRFTTTSALMGNDVSAYPDFPAEIRAPAGSLVGVSAFQIHFSSRDIRTPGDMSDVLVAMNPAALKVSLKNLVKGGTIIANSDAFSERNLRLAKYDSNPLEDGSLSGYRVIAIPISKLTQKALQELELGSKVADRSKNFFALGVVFWLFDRDMESTEAWIRGKFARQPEIVEANLRALKTGYNFADISELFTSHYRVAPAEQEPGLYRNLNGTEALALGLVAAAERAGLPLFYAGYPITPASELLHRLARLKSYGVKVMQAEDEISAAGAALGAAYGGSIGVTGTSGPGLALKSEFIGLAVMVELPLVVINLQRGGPSTGLPTKMEQTDLFQAVHGRNAESPLPVLAAATPGDSFYTIIEAVRIALQYMTPVIVLSDGYLANGAEPWKIPDIEELPEIPVRFETSSDEFLPYGRNQETLVRKWAVPGTPGLEHRIGGLEKEDGTGNVSYDPENHQRMVEQRAKKIENVAKTYASLAFSGPEKGKVLVVSWGSSFGAVSTSVDRLQGAGHSIAHIHLRHLHPLHPGLEKILSGYDVIAVPELNMGQLRHLLEARFARRMKGISKVTGQPFSVEELTAAFKSILENGKL